MVLKLIKQTIFFTGAIGGLLLSGCSGAKPEAAFTKPAAPSAGPVYSSLAYWAAHPAKQDPSDSLPAPYRKGFAVDTSVDVFFLHPTSYLAEEAIDKSLAHLPEEKWRWNANLADSLLNLATDNSSILNQASAFNRHPVYAPRYRQAHIQTYYIPDSIAKPFFEIAYADVRAAFEYYLAHENNGRPFIIAAHSQGTTHAGRLIREMIEGTPLQQKLVAAYLVGMPVPANYFTQLPPCSNPSQTGCFVAWRTFKKGYIPPRVAEEPFKAIVINPISWTQDTLPVRRKNHQGALLYKFNNPKPRNVSTQIAGNVLWSTKPRFFGNILLTRKNYHIGDINLFWKDIRDNVDLRVAAYLTQ